MKSNPEIRVQVTARSRPTPPATFLRSHHVRSRRRWAVSLLAFIAVGGLTASNVRAQSTVPRVQSVAFANSPVRGDTYELGEKIVVTVRFNRPVKVADVSLNHGASALKVA